MFGSSEVYSRRTPSFIGSQISSRESRDLSAFRDRKHLFMRNKGPWAGRFSPRPGPGGRHIIWKKSDRRGGGLEKVLGGGVGVSYMGTANWRIYSGGELKLILGVYNLGTRGAGGSISDAKE